MPQPTDPAEGATLEECIDELDACINRAERYPPELMAFALRIHLGSLLHVLLQQRTWSASQIREFLGELNQEVLDGE